MKIMLWALRAPSMGSVPEMFCVMAASWMCPGSALGLCGGPRVCPGAVGGHLMPQALDYQDPNTAQLCRL